MATWFVDGTAGSSGNAGTSWAVPKQTVSQAIALASSGDVIAVGSTGAFTATAAINWTLLAGNLAIISATNPGSGTTVTPAAGASESVGAASAAFSIIPAAGSCLYVFGMTMAGGTNVSSSSSLIISQTGAVNSFMEFKSCTLSLPTTGTTPQTRIGNSSSNNTQGSYIRFKDCTFSFGSRAGGPAITFGQSDIEIINPSFTFGATQPASLFGQNIAGASTALAVIRDGDLSAYNSAGAYFNLALITSSAIIIKNCKLSATPSLTTGSWPAATSGSIELRNVDSGNTTYTYQYQNANGTLTQSTSVYNNADTQFGGATNISWQIVTTANASQFYPFFSPPIEMWTTKTTAQTPTIEIAQASGAASLTDQDIWCDLEYPASATDPHYTFASGRNTAPITGTGTNWTTSTATWTGLTTPVLQKLNPAGNGNTFTAAAVGLLMSRIMVAKASTTVYIDPQLTGVS